MDKFALVTGGGVGIGKATALKLAKAGWHVAVTGRRLEPLEAVVRDIEGHGRRGLAKTCDVSDPVQVRALFDAVQAEFGRLDLLFNNAGFNIVSSALEDIAYDQWMAVVAANLTGAFLCTQQAFRLMKSQQPRGGRIINNGSISAHVPRPNSAPYTATKHAITGLTRSTALDGRKFDIACGQIDIGNAGTDMTARMSKGVPQADGSLAPEPTIDPQHIARAVAYMATLPLDANVPFITVMATKMPYIGRG